MSQQVWLSSTDQVFDDLHLWEATVEGVGSSNEPAFSCSCSANGCKEVVGKPVLPTLTLLPLPGISNSAALTSNSRVRSVPVPQQYSMERYGGHSLTTAQRMSDRKSLSPAQSWTRKGNDVTHPNPPPNDEPN